MLFEWKIKTEIFANCAKEAIFADRTLAEYLAGRIFPVEDQTERLWLCSMPIPKVRWPFTINTGGEIMNTQDAIRNQDRFASDNRPEPTLQVEETENRIVEIVTRESTSTGPIPHHSTCCCASCWTENIKYYL